MSAGDTSRNGGRNGGRNIAYLDAKHRVQQSVFKIISGCKLRDARVTIDEPWAGDLVSPGVHCIEIRAKLGRQVIAVQDSWFMNAELFEWHALHLVREAVDRLVAQQERPEE